MNNNKTKMMNKNESWQTFHIWLLVSVVILGCHALNPISFFTYNSVQSFCIFTFISIIVLCILAAYTGNVYWFSGISYEETEKAGKKACRKYGIWNLLIYLAAFVCYLFYCWLKSRAFVNSSTHHAIAGAVILTFAVVFAGKIPLQKR